jgi:hypothetical protein
MMTRAASRLLGSVAGLTIVLYVATSRAYITGSLTPGDLLVLTLLCVLLLSEGASRAVLRLVLGPYGILALAITAAVLVSALHSRRFLAALNFDGQLLFTVWLAVPIVAAGIAELRDPFRFLRRLGVAYLVFFALGLVLLFGAGNDAILFRSGIGRVFQRFTTHPLQMILMAVGFAGAAFAARRRLRHLLLLALSLIPVLLNANRTWMVTLALLAVMAALGAARSARSLFAVVIGIAILGGVAYLVLGSSLVQDTWQIRLLNAPGFLEDEIRVASVQASLDAVSRHAGTLLLGEGWGSSGGDIVVHNVVIQVLHEGGIFVLAALLALLALPAVWVLGARGGDRMTRQFVLMLTGAFVLFWMLNALSVERVYWMAYAVALGLAHRLRIGPAPAAAAAAFPAAPRLGGPVPA